MKDVNDDARAAIAAGATKADVDKITRERASTSRKLGRPKKQKTARNAKATQAGNQAGDLVELAARAELFHDADYKPYASFQVNEHRENWGLDSEGFKRWLNREFFEVFGKAPCTQAFQDALATLKAKAIYDGTKLTVAVRLGDAEGNIYLDLGDADWRSVEISPDGWSLNYAPPVRFLRPNGLLPLPEPVQGGRPDALKELLNITDNDWPLLAGWLIGAFRPHGPYAILFVSGEQGSSKSTTCKYLRLLIDPNKAPLRSEPGNIQDMMIAAQNSRVLAFDNLSHIKGWFSDALCRLSTGGGFATRALFTNGDETIFEAKRPIIVNGIEDLANKSDLLDRAVCIRMLAIPEDKRLTEDALNARFIAAQPAILGAFLTAASAALKNFNNTKLEKPPRMADFALWVVAGEHELGLKSGEFLRAYHSNRKESDQQAIDANPVGVAVVELMSNRGYWSGSATQLLTDLKAPNSEMGYAKSWPKSASKLTGTLRRLCPNFRRLGIDISFNHAKTRIVTINKTGNQSSQASVPLTEDET